MFFVLSNAWALLLGMFLLQIGNGMQGTALGIRGGIEGFDPALMGFVMSGYFVGFFGGAWLTPKLIRRVGHVRVFAALASLISAAFILYAWAVDPIAWTIMRLIVGLCFSGVYVAAESWLNNQSTNETRGQTLSAYLICQMGGIVLAQAAIPVFDASGYELFVLMSVAVSIACAPILLSASPAPVAGGDQKRLSIIQLFKISPLGAVGMMCTGAIFACMFGMTAVFGTAAGLDTSTISATVAALYIGALVLQFPIGWISDRMDRRQLIAALALAGTAGCLLMLLAGTSMVPLLVAAFLVGGAANPLYSVLTAHTNDFMELDEMAAAAGGLILLNGVGSAGTPILVGALITSFGPAAFPVFMGVMFGLLTLYALYRMTVRPATPVDETLPYAAVLPSSSAVVYQEYYAEAAEAMASEEEAEEDFGDVAPPGGQWSDGDGPEQNGPEQGSPRPGTPAA
ncbi:MAG: MFS transporter, partial [Pseudomonadota bacterium]